MEVIKMKNKIMVWIIITIIILLSLFIHPSEIVLGATQSGEVPVDGSTGITTTPDLYVLCNDAELDIMNATWWSNSSGSWVQFASDSSFINGTNITQTNSNFSSEFTTYYWSVNLTDNGINWVNTTYHFTTWDVTAPIMSHNETSNLTITWNITINDNSGSFNWTIECNGQRNSSDSDSNGTKSITLFNLSENVTYTVFINVTDSSGNTIKQICEFIIGGTCGAVITTIIVSTSSGGTSGSNVGLATSLSVGGLVGVLFAMVFIRIKLQKKENRN